MAIKLLTSDEQAMLMICSYAVILILFITVIVCPVQADWHDWGYDNNLGQWYKNETKTLQLGTTDMEAKCNDINPVLLPCDDGLKQYLYGNGYDVFESDYWSDSMKYSISGDNVSTAWHWYGECCYSGSHGWHAPIGYFNMNETEYTPPVTGKPNCYWMATPTTGDNPLTIHVTDISSNNPTTVFFYLRLSGTTSVVDTCILAGGTGCDMVTTIPSWYDLEMYAENREGNCNSTSYEVFLATNNTMPQPNVTPLPTFFQFTTIPTELPTLPAGANATYIRQNISEVLPFADPILGMIDDTERGANNVILFFINLVVNPLLMINNYFAMVIYNIYNYIIYVGAPVQLLLASMARIIDFFPPEVNALITLELSYDTVLQILGMVESRKVVKGT